MAKNASTHFRVDINGLRGLAVLAVICYHIFPEALPGGFYGVDIFFVISGFLITDHIKKYDNEKFSLIEFYMKRVQRLTPALITVLFTVGLVGYLTLLPVELVDLSKDEIFSDLYISNIRLYFQQGYFDRDAKLKPLLNLWSLGVEGQFYLIWPIFIVFMKGVFKKIFILSVFISYLLCLILSFEYPEINFYFLIPRLWEFGIGAFLAVRTHTKIMVCSSEILEKFGLFCIFMSLFFLSPSPLFPAPAAVFPTVGTFCVLASNNPKGIGRYFLDNKFMQLIGRVSYPLYLWHWPIFSFANIIYGVYHLTNIIRFIILFLSFVLSILTERFVERPFRNNLTHKKAAITSLSFSAIIIIASSLTIFHNGWVKIHRGLLPIGINLNKINLAINDGVFPLPAHMSIQRDGGLVIGTFAPGLGNPIIFSGDSLLFQWSPRIEELLVQNRLNRTVIFIGGASCSPVPGKEYNKKFRFCADLPWKLLHLVNNKNINTIVIGAYWDTFLRSDPHEFMQIEQYIASLSQNGRRSLFFIKQTPVSKSFAPDEMVDRSFFHVSIKNDVIVSGIPFDAFKENPSSIQTLQRLANIFGGHIIDLTQEICGSPTVCYPLMKDGTPKFSDTEHLRPIFTRKNIYGLDFLFDNKLNSVNINP